MLRRWPRRPARVPVRDCGVWQRWERALGQLHCPPKGLAPVNHHSFSGRWAYPHGCLDPVCHGLSRCVRWPPALRARLWQQGHESLRGSGAGGQAGAISWAEPVCPAPRRGGPAAPAPLQLRRQRIPAGSRPSLPAPRAGPAGRRRSRRRRGALRPLRRSGPGVRTRRRRLGGAGPGPGPGP